MNRPALLIASIFLLFSRSSVGQICLHSAYVPGDFPSKVQKNTAGNYLILSRNSVIEIPPVLVGGQSFPIPPYYQHLREVADSYLLAGSHKNAGSSLVYSALIAQKSTKQGEVVWYQPNIESSLEYNEVSCTGFGVMDTTGASFIASRRKIYRLNDIGHAFDTVSVTTANMDELLFVTQAANGDFVALARKYSIDYHWQTYQLRFDSSLNFQSSKLVDFTGDHQYSFLSVEAVLPNGDWLLLGSVSEGYQMLRLDAAGDLLWKQENLACVPGFPCADLITGLVPIGDFIWRMEVTADGHPQIVRCTANGEVAGQVDLGSYGSIYGRLEDAVSGVAPNQVLVVGYEQTGTPGNYTLLSIAILLNCEKTTGYIDHHTMESAIVSPNPAQQSFSVQLPATAEYRLLLQDAMGRCWKNDSFTSASAIVDCAALPAGLYFLSIEGKGGAMYRTVVAVVH